MKRFLGIIHHIECFTYNLIFRECYTWIAFFFLISEAECMPLLPLIIVPGNLN